MPTTYYEWTAIGGLVCVMAAIIFMILVVIRERRATENMIQRTSEMLRTPIVTTDMAPRRILYPGDTVWWTDPNDYRQEPHCCLVTSVHLDETVDIQFGESGLYGCRGNIPRDQLVTIAPVGRNINPTTF